MGGIRTAGDLVARMQMTRKMRLPEAKRYVAEKLDLSVTEISDSTVMRRVREDLDIGVITAVAGAAKGLEAKVRIADLLGIRVNSVERLKPRWCSHPFRIVGARDRAASCPLLAEVRPPPARRRRPPSRSAVLAPRDERGAAGSWQTSTQKQPRAS